MAALNLFSNLESKFIFVEFVVWLLAFRRYVFGNGRLTWLLIQVIQAITWLMRNSWYWFFLRLVFFWQMVAELSEIRKTLEILLRVLFDVVYMWNVIMFRNLKLRNILILHRYYNSQIIFLPILWWFLIIRHLFILQFKFIYLLHQAVIIRFIVP